MGKTLNQFIEELQEIKSKYPHAGDLPVIYAKDAEGNGYHACYFTPQLFKVKDTNEFYMDSVDTNDKTPIREYNCVIVN